MSQTRESNLTDAYRILAAFSIVWYHSEYYWFLGKYTALADNTKLLLSGWAMPFFWVTLCRYALITSLRNTSKAVSRILAFIVMIFTYTLIYEIPRLIRGELHYHGATYIPFNISLKDIPSFTSSVFSTVKGVNSSPGYFLFDSLVIYISAIIVSRLFSKKLPKYSGTFVTLIGFIVFDLIFNPLDHQAVLSYIFNNPNALNGIAVGFLYHSLVSGRLSKKYEITSNWQALLILFVPILVFGCINLFWLRNNFFRFLPLWSIFPLIGDLFSCKKNKLISQLSEWGRKYSFGIFILHAFMLGFLDMLIPILWKRSGLSHPSILLYCIINICAFFAALATTHFLRKKASWLVDLTNTPKQLIVQKVLSQ